MKILFLLLVSVFFILGSHYLYDMPNKFEKYIPYYTCSELCYSLHDVGAIISLDDGIVSNMHDDQTRWNWYCSVCGGKYPYTFDRLESEDQLAVWVWRSIS